MNDADVPGLRVFLEHALIDGELVEGTAASGVAKQAVRQGLESLTEKQWQALQTFLDNYDPGSCHICETQFSWEDLGNPDRDPRYCNYHDEVVARDRN